MYKTIVFTRPNWYVINKFYIFKDLLLCILMRLFVNVLLTITCFMCLTIHGWGFFCPTCAKKSYFWNYMHISLKKKNWEQYCKIFFVIGLTPVCCLCIWSYFNQRKLLLFLKIHPLVFISFSYDVSLCKCYFLYWNISLQIKCINLFLLFSLMG